MPSDTDAPVETETETAAADTPAESETPETSAAPADPFDAVLEASGESEEESLAVAPAHAPITAEALPEILGDSLSLSDEQSEAFLSALNDTTLSPTERAKSFASLGEQLLADAGRQLADDFNNLQSERQNELINDPEIGGKNLKTSINEAKRIATAYGGKEVLDVFAQTGIINNLQFTKMLVNIAKELPGEPDPLQGDVVTETKDLANRLFG